MNFIQNLSFLFISSILAQQPAAYNNNANDLQYSDNTNNNNNANNTPQNNPQNNPMNNPQNRAQVRQSVASFKQDAFQSIVPTGTFRDNMSARRQEQVNSISSYAMANGVNTMNPEDRQAFMSSMVVANSAMINERKQSAASFMATQTQINSVSLAQAVSSIQATATADPKKKNFFAAMKQKKASKVADGSANPTATSSKGSGFQNFFKSIQGKIQKSSSVAAATSSA
jgi:hypothetical protein